MPQADIVKCFKELSSAVFFALQRLTQGVLSTTQTVCSVAVTLRGRA